MVALQCVASKHSKAIASTLQLTTREKSNTHLAIQMAGPNLRAFYRSIQFQIVPQATKWRNSHELKKTAIYRSRKAAIFHALVHIIPLTTATTIVILNVRTMFIGSVSTNVITAIRFASKLLEVLMQASIAAVVLACVRTRVLRSHELPFGGLTTPFTVKDLSSLWSLELWSCLTANNIDVTTRISFVFFLVAVVLTGLVGPSSAVLMIPRRVSYLTSTELMFLHQSELVYPRDVKLSGGWLM